MLVDYRQRVKAQFDVLVQEASIQREKFNAVVTEVKPVLDYVDLEAAPQPNGRPQHSDTIIQRCKAAWENFKSFNREPLLPPLLTPLRWFGPNINPWTFRQ